VSVLGFLFIFEIFFLFIYFFEFFFKNKKFVMCQAVAVSHGSERVI